MLSVGYDEQDKGPTPEPLDAKEVHLAVARDDLLRLRVGLGETVATAIVDTGSQLNLVSEKVFMESGLIRTEENIVSVTSATGEGNTCIRTIPEAEIYLLSGKIVTAGPEIHVIKHAPFQVLLGRPWLTMNGVSIEERKEGTCLVFELDKTRYVINVSPNPSYTNGEGGVAKKGKTSKKETYMVLAGEEEIVYDTETSDEEEETSESEVEAKGQDVVIGCYFCSYFSSIFNPTSLHIPYPTPFSLMSISTMLVSSMPLCLHAHEQTTRTQFDWYNRTPNNSSTGLSTF